MYGEELDFEAGFVYRLNDKIVVSVFSIKYIFFKVTLGFPREKKTLHNHRHKYFD